MVIFKGQSFSYLLEQQSSVQYNAPICGPGHGKALMDSILRRKKNGETIQKLSAPRVIVRDEVDETGRVEMIKCGGKGQYMRVVHPA